MVETKQSLYERLGEEVGIRAVVDEFYDRLTADPDLSGYFAGRDMPTLRRHQVAMLSVATGGPNRYDGRDMATAHAGLRISGEHFDRVVAHLVDTLTDLNIEAEAIAEVGAVLTPLRPAIVSD